jgi:hypothetical protein
LVSTGTCSSLDLNDLRRSICVVEPATEKALTKRSLWLFVSLAVCFSAASALAYLGYMGQGIAAGAVLGLPGREQDVAAYQRDAMHWLVASLLSQVGVVGSLLPLVRISPNDRPWASVAARLLATIVFAIVLTFVVAGVMSAVAQLTHKYL